MRTNPAAVQRCGGRQLAAGNWTRNATHGLDTGEGNRRLTSIFISPRLAPSVSRGFVEETPQFQPVVTLRNSATCTMFILARDTNDSHLSKEQERRVRYNIAVYGRLQSSRLEALRIRASVALVVSMWNELVQMRGGLGTVADFRLREPGENTHVCAEKTTKKATQKHKNRWMSGIGMSHLIKLRVLTTAGRPEP